MKSFGSTLDKAGGAMGNQFDNQNTGLWKTKKKSFFDRVGDAVSTGLAGGLIKGFRKGLGGAMSKIGEVDTEIPYSTEFDPAIDFKDSNKYNIINTSKIKPKYEVTKDIYEYRGINNKVRSEDTTKWDQSVMDQMNWYNFSGGVALNSYDVFQTDGTNQYRQADAQHVVHSLFNPYYGLDTSGIGPYQPLAAQEDWDGFHGNNYLGDCRISTLVRLSKQKASILGQARYKYADFMFCKELGLPNNHLITLRRFVAPIGDMIHGAESVDTKCVITEGGGSTGKMYVRHYKNTAQMSDVGHMCCYFGGEDNKLEDILKYSFKSTYTRRESQIQRLESREDSRRSPLGMVINSSSKGYAQHMAQSSAGNNNILSWAAEKSGSKVVNKLFGQESWYGANSALYYVDKNKIYEPPNTIQEMDLYEGKLVFNHEFSIVFSYKLRAYDNISPKAAMLDLLANITRTCYNRGNFWGGRKQINGPQPNASGWNKANAFIDNTWDRLGSGLVTFLNGGFDMSNLLSSFTGAVSSAVNSIKAGVGSVVESMKAGTFGTGLGDKMVQWNKRFGFGQMLKGKLKDALGRPQLYCFDSLLTGGDTGMWHLTIGNPLQPIVTIGNLEITNTEIQHLGPLGIDDFPTELKVTVSFKHARPRDAVAIEKMYIYGGRTIYKTHVRTDPSKIYKINKVATAKESREVLATEERIYQNDLNKAKAEAKARERAKKNSDNGSNSDKPTQTESVPTTNSNSSINVGDYSKIIDTAETRGGGSLYTGEETMDGLEYIGEFDYKRIKANMDELA